MEMKLEGKEQFKQGPPQPMTEEERAKKEQEMMEQMKEDTPFLTARVEYNRLQIEALEQEVKLGIRPANSVGGLLGLELQVKELNHIHYLTQLKNQLDQMIEDEKKMKEATEKAPQSKGEENP